MTKNNVTLLIPDKPDKERDAVADEWSLMFGDVVFTCKLIRDALLQLNVGETISESGVLNDILSGLERLIPSFLSVQFEFWKHESLDGIFPLKVLKIDINELYLIGMCVLISDQTIIPVCLTIKLNNDNDTINSFKCKIGENVNNKLNKFEFSSNAWKRKLYSLDENKITWYFNTSIKTDGQLLKNRNGESK
jgi:hypothetical protein